MKDFLAHMNLARWIILGSLVGSLALGWNGWRLRARRIETEASLKREVPMLALDIQTLSRAYSKLYKESEREGLKPQDDPQSYIRKLALHDSVLLGGIDITGPTEIEPVKGVVDKKYTLKPQARDKGVLRLKLANFFYMLESESRRVRVTHIMMEPELKNVKPNEVSNDMWRWEAEVTARQKKEGA
jgi:hypothetical protein